MSSSKLTEQEWLTIRAEWESGLLSLRQIAANFNINKQTIVNKAKKENWPPRNQVEDVVKRVATVVAKGDRLPANEPVVASGGDRLVLDSFYRVIRLLREHRGDLTYLHLAVKANLERVERIVNLRIESGKRLTLKEEQMVADILAKAVGSMSKLVPLERRAFGLSNEEISEFDTFTSEQLDDLETHIRQVIN